MTKTSMEEHLTSLGFLLALGNASLPVVTIWLSKITHHPDITAFYGLIIFFVSLPIMEWILTYSIKPASDIHSLELCRECGGRDHCLLSSREKALTDFGSPISPVLTICYLAQLISNSRK